MKVSTNIKTYVKYKVDEFANTVLEDLKDQKQALYEELVKHDETVRKLFSEEQDKFRTNLVQRLSAELPSESIFASDEYRRDEVCSIPLVDLINRLTANQLPIVTNDNYISICMAIHDLQLVKSHTVNKILVGLELETIDPKDIDKEISLSFDGYSVSESLNAPNGQCQKKLNCSSRTRNQGYLMDTVFRSGYYFSN